MPRTALPVLEVIRAGLVNPAATACDFVNWNEFTNDGHTILQVVSTDTGSQTVTIVTPSTVDGQAIADLVVWIPPGQTVYIGPFPPAIYGGRVAVNTVVTTLSFRVLHLSTG